MATLDDRVPVWRTMLVFIVPLLLSSILQAASGTITNVYLARLIDMRAFAANAIMLPLLYLIVSLAVGISSAGSIVVARARGAEDETEIRRAAGAAVGVALLGGALVGGSAFAAVDLILRAVGAPSDLYADAAAYARVSFATMPILFVFFSYSGLIRGLGDSRTPFVLLLLTDAIFIAATPLLILGLFGLPRLGIIGLPVANAAAMAIATIVTWAYLERRKSPLSLGRSFRYLVPSARLAGTIVHLGVPTAVQIMVVALGEVAVLAFVNRFGPEATAAFGAVNQLLTYVQFPANALTATAAVFGAQSIGAKRLDRVPQIARAGFAINYLLGGATIALCYAFAGPLLGLFITDPHTLGLARSLLDIALWGYVVFGNTSVLTGLMRSNGTVLWPTIWTVAGIWVVQVPLAWVLSNGPLGVSGIWVAYPAGLIFAFVAVGLTYRLGWLRSLAPAGVPVAGSPA